MRVSKVFTMGGNWGHGGGYGYGGYAPYLPYRSFPEKPCGYYPDCGRWTYVAPNGYRWQGDGSGYGASRSHGLDGLVG
jgi:hypothetical protein